MAQSQPVYASCEGGLILNSNLFDLLGSAGVARELRNFEVSLDGGYRRINGYQKYARTDGTQPTGSGDNILGVTPYALGIVVCAGTDVYYTEDGISWTQINKDTGESGVTESNLSSQTTLSRPSQGKAQFAIAKGTEDHADNPYGVLYIATGPDQVAHFHIDGTGSPRTFTYTELSTPSAGKWIDSHNQHLCVVDSDNDPNTIYYSATNDFDDFSGTGSGSITLSGRIEGIKSFRSKLYIFTENSIHELININDSNNIAVQGVTSNLGCIDGFTIQEIGGDLIFLAPDGLRTVAATERIDDVNISNLSSQIQPILTNIVENSSTYTLSSVVIRKKSQYRLFYIDSGGNGHGVIGTLKYGKSGQASSSGQGASFQWSEIRNLPVYSITSYFDQDNEEVIYHGGDDGYVYEHDTGTSFNGSNIQAEYLTPYVHLDDLGTRKTLNYLNVAISNEGDNDIVLKPNFDFDSTNTIQPETTTIEIDNTVATYGVSTYGTAEYGSLLEQINRVPLQGSGHSVAFKFITNDRSTPYTIHGLHIESFPDGRK